MRLTKICLVIAVLLIGSAPAQAEVIINERIPWGSEVWVSCANGGDGEMVMLDGTLHVQIREVEDGAGGYHWGNHFQPMGVEGVGLVTGDMYRATGGTMNMYNEQFPGCPNEYSFQNNFRIIGQGPGNNFLVHENYHVVIDENCDLHVEQMNYSVDCK